MKAESKMKAALACGLLWWSCAALAETPKGGGDAAMIQTLRKAQGMLRQLAQEKAEMEAGLVAKDAALAEQAKALEALQVRIKQLEPLENEVKQQKASLESLQASQAALQQRISGDAERLRASAEKQRKTVGQLEKYRRDNALLISAVQERTHWIEDCSGKNQALLRANREWLDQHGDKNLWEHIIANEPLLGIGAVTEENTVEAFRYKLGDLEVTPWRESGADSGRVSPVADSGAADASPGQGQDEDEEEDVDEKKGTEPVPDTSRSQ